MDKCEWRNGKLHFCDEFVLKTETVYENRSRIAKTIKNGGMTFMCNHCNTVIRKPIPTEPIIKKSGGTFVAQFYGQDYLCLDPNHINADILTSEEFLDAAYPESKHGVSYWRPFSEIEITDDIAILRPMVLGEYYPKMLYGVVEDQLIFSHTNGKKEDYRLATIEDLDKTS